MKNNSARIKLLLNFINNSIVRTQFARPTAGISVRVGRGQKQHLRPYGNGLSFVILRCLLVCSLALINYAHPGGERDQISFIFLDDQ